MVDNTTLNKTHNKMLLNKKLKAIKGCRKKKISILNMAKMLEKEMNCKMNVSRRSTHAKEKIPTTPAWRWGKR